jgi:AhpD family alkylhydroperoxidase
MTTAEATEARIEFADFERTAPEARAALSALSKAVGDSGLDKGLTELIKIRASQVNGCAFCVQFHLNLARKMQVRPDEAGSCGCVAGCRCVYEARDGRACVDGGVDGDWAGGRWR